MKPITIDKLKSFVLKEDEYNLSPEQHHKELLQIYTTDNFSIASNGHMVAVIYNSEDHNLNYTFGHGMDVITSLLTRYHNEDLISNCQIIFNRQLVLDAIKQQFQILKLQFKEKYKKTITELDCITKFYIDCQQFKLHIMTYNVNLYNKQAKKIVSTREFIIKEQPEIGVDFIQPNKYKATQLKTWFSAYNTKYILDYLKFMDNCEHITLITGGSSVQPIRSEEQDREILLLPVTRIE